MKNIFLQVLCFIFFIVFLFFSCKEKSFKNEKFYDNGNLKEFILFSNNEVKAVYSFYENGVIKSIRRYNYNESREFRIEELWFYPTGILNRKIPFLNGKANGNAYYFYDTTGSIKSDRYFRNDVQVFYGADYWDDSLGTMKASLHFNNSGQIFYKKNFDENGKLLSEEGQDE